MELRINRVPPVITFKVLFEETSLHQNEKYLASCEIGKNWHGVNVVSLTKNTQNTLPTWRRQNVIHHKIGLSLLAI